MIGQLKRNYLMVLL